MEPTDENVVESAAPKKRMSKKTKAIILIVVVVLALFGVLFGRKYFIPQTEKAQNAALMQSVAKLILVPNEQPVIANINDADTLIQEQPFYLGSQNGDKLIIFPTAQKAIIFSPSRHIIVNAGPFVVNSSAAAAKQ